MWRKEAWGKWQDNMRKFEGKRKIKWGKWQGNVKERCVREIGEKFKGKMGRKSQGSVRETWRKECEGNVWEITGKCEERWGKIGSVRCWYQYGCVGLALTPLFDAWQVSFDADVAHMWGSPLPARVYQMPPSLCFWGLFPVSQEERGQRWLQAVGPYTQPMLSKESRSTHLSQGKLISCGPRRAFSPWERLCSSRHAGTAHVWNSNICPWTQGEAIQPLCHLFFPGSQPRGLVWPQLCQVASLLQLCFLVSGDKNSQFFAVVLGMIPFLQWAA